MIKLLVIAGILAIPYLFPHCRTFMLHPLLTIKYACKDIYKYFKYKRYNECKEFGKIVCATALFGGGKTLSSSMYVRSIYNQYNGKKVYNFDTKKFEPQKIKVISNVDFNDIPYLPLKSADDIIHAHDGETSTCVVLIFIDEASTEFNSRNFKTNLPTELLNQILTCRHHKIGMILTAQRFGHMDALLRQVTAYEKHCSKFWRSLLIKYYDAWDVENCTNLDLLKPIKTKVSFVKDSDYNAYDTYAIVENFKHEVSKGNILTDSEVLENQGSTSVELSQLKNPHKRKIKKFL